jgi:general secretion pathway protein N
MRARAAAVLVALVLLVAAFAVLAPAALLDARIAAMTHDGLRLADASGTVWRGSGTLCDAQGRWRVPLAWRIGMLDALRGALTLELMPGARTTARGLVSASNDTLSFFRLHLELPAAALASAWREPPVPRFAGMVVADAPSFRTDGTHVDGAMDLRWDRAAVSLAGVAVDLGTVEASARPGAGGMTVALRNRGGDLALTGEVRTQGNDVALDATLKPEPTLAGPARIALRALGPAAADGSVHVTWHGPR